MRLRGVERDLPRLQEIARQKVDAARVGYATMAKRPFGPGRRDRAFAELLIELDRIVQIVQRPFHEQSVVRPGLLEADRLVNSVVSALRSSADVLSGGAPPDLHAIEVARQLHRGAPDRWAAAHVIAGPPAQEVAHAPAFD